MDHGKKAAELFLNGYNCAQAVFMAFSDVTGISETESARIASSFGGGMGRMREVCGAVSGMLLAAGVLYGYTDPEDDGQKMAHYALVQQLAGEFRAEAGSIVCRELLDNPPADPKPSPRTADYYAERPCSRFVLLAGRILDAYMEEHPIGAK